METIKQSYDEPCKLRGMSVKFDCSSNNLMRRISETPS